MLYFPTWRTSRKLHVYNWFVTSKPRKSFLFSRSFHALSSLFPRSFHVISTLFPSCFRPLSAFSPRSFYSLKVMFLKSILNLHPAIWLRATVTSEEQKSTREKYLLISRKATVIWVSITADNKEIIRFEWWNFIDPEKKQALIESCVTFQYFSQK